MNWNELNIYEKADLMKLYVANGVTDLDTIKQHYNSFAQGGSLPDHDPDNPYHYHDAAGNKVVITPEEWEANVGKPYFKEVEDAVRAEQAAYSAPEYEVNPAFLRDLNHSVATTRGENGMINFYGYRNQIPEGYTINENGIIFDKEGNAYVQESYPQNTRFTYNSDSPLQFTFNKGKPIERNVNFYPINMDKRVKAPLPVDKVMNVKTEYENAITNYITNNDKIINKSVPTYNIGYVSADDLSERRFANSTLSGITTPFLYAMGNSNAPTIRVPESDNEIINEFYNDIIKNKTYVRVEGRYPDLTREQALDLLQELDMDQIIDVDKFKLPKKYDIKVQQKIRPSRQEAEKKAIISIGPLERVNTFATGGSLGKVTPYGQWQYPGKVTTIPSNNITMKGVNYPVIGVSNTGDTKYMLPNMDYLFEGNYVTEYPINK